MNVLLKDESREIFKYSGSEEKFDLLRFDKCVNRWKKYNRSPYNKLKLKTWCLASLLYGAAVRLLIS